MCAWVAPAVQTFLNDAIRNLRHVFFRLPVCASVYIFFVCLPVRDVAPPLRACACNDPDPHPDIAISMLASFVVAVFL